MLELTWFPALAMAGHEVISVSRQKRKPYSDHAAWKHVKQVIIDRVEADKKKTFGKQISKLSPDVVIDLICFTPESARIIAEALTREGAAFSPLRYNLGTWSSEVVPTDEDTARRPFGDYGIKKAAIESWLLSFSHLTGFPATILHPGHIVGPGWIPLNPAGNFNPDVYKTLAAGKELASAKPGNGDGSSCSC